MLDYESLSECFNNIWTLLEVTSLSTFDWVRSVGKLEVGYLGRFLADGFSIVMSETRVRSLF